MLADPDIYEDLNLPIFILCHILNLFSWGGGGNIESDPEVAKSRNQIRIHTKEGPELNHW